MSFSTSVVEIADDGKQSARRAGRLGSEPAVTSACVDRVRQRRGRSARAIRNDERLWAAVTDAIVERGIDRVVARDVVQRCGLTTGALYGRYDSMDDLFADVWLNRAGPAFRDLVTLAARIGGGEVTPTDADDLGRQSADLRAAGELCILAGRVGELADVVPRDVRAWLLESGIDRDARAAGVLGLLLGTLLYAPVDDAFWPEVPVVLGWLANGGDAEWSGPPPEPVPPVPIDFDDGDEGRALLLRAATQVAARSGVQHATLKRIGRVAGHVPSAVYHRYTNREELFTDLVVASSRFAIEPNDELSATFASPDNMASRLCGWMQPGSRMRRRITIECCLAIAHVPELAAAVVGVCDASDTELAGAFSPPGTPLHESLCALFRAARNTVYGLCLLEETSGLFAPMDWRPFVHPVTTGMLLGAS